MKRILAGLAPFIAVAVFWLGLHNAWLTLLAYHAQILFWSRHRLGLLWRGWDAKLFLLLALPCVAAGPLMYVLMPYMTDSAASLPQWLSRVGLQGPALTVMVPYYGLVHPLLEQAHWSELRSSGLPAHAAFAGYHALILGTLLHAPWVVLCVAVLFAASFLWSRLEARTGGLLVPCAGHLLADIGVVAVAWLKGAS